LKAPEAWRKSETDPPPAYEAVSRCGRAPSCLAWDDWSARARHNQARVLGGIIISSSLFLFLEIFA